jgi:hypothetical protein
MDTIEIIIASPDAHRIIPDDTYPAMFRIHWADGVISDMANITRCREAIDRYLETSERQDRRRRQKQRQSPPDQT